MINLVCIVFLMCCLYCPTHGAPSILLVFCTFSCQTCRGLGFAEPLLKISGSNCWCDADVHIWPTTPVVLQRAPTEKLIWQLWKVNRLKLLTKEAWIWAFWLKLLAFLLCGKFKLHRILVKEIISNNSGAELSAMWVCFYFHCCNSEKMNHWSLIFYLFIYFFKFLRRLKSYCATFSFPVFLLTFQRQSQIPGNIHYTLSLIRS